MKKLVKTISIRKTILMAIIGIFALSFQSCQKNSITPDVTHSEAFVAFDDAMHQLWAEHMQYTFMTVDAFYNNANALDAQLGRLLKNQEDIGNAIIPYYGQVAGDQLTQLLKEHILGAVPVLTAAQEGDDAALDIAVADWFANGEEIATFLSEANPDHWDFEEMKGHMGGHLVTTIDYAVSLLQQNYVQATEDYDIAAVHMVDFAHELAIGIAKQFPEKF